MFCDGFAEKYLSNYTNTQNELFWYNNIDHKMSSFLIPKYGTPTFVNTFVLPGLE